MYTASNFFPPPSFPIRGTSGNIPLSEVNPFPPALGWTVTVLGLVAFVLDSPLLSPPLQPDKINSSEERPQSNWIFFGIFIAYFRLVLSAFIKIIKNN